MKHFIIFVILGSLTLAQEPGPRPLRGDLPMERDRFEMMKMWKLTDHLNLNEDQATKFFPRYRGMNERILTLNKEEKELMEGFKTMLEGEGEMESGDLDKLIGELRTIEEKKVQEKFDFVNGLSDILIPEQIARYIMFEIRFKHELQQVLKDKRREMMERKRPHERRKMRDRW